MIDVKLIRNLDDRTILSHFARGEDIDQIVKRINRPRDYINGLIMGVTFSRQYAAELVRAYDTTVNTTNGRKAKEADMPAPKPAQRPSPVPPPSPTPPVPPPPTWTPPRQPIEPAADPIEDILTRAHATAEPRLIKLATSIRAQLDQLTELLNAGERAAELRAAIARLNTERQAAQIELDKLVGKRTFSLNAGTRPGVIRAWARQNGIPCPAMGRVPGPVVQAYEAATTEQI